jgi:hypothetical protein
MPPARMTPALAVDYVRELSADVRAAVVLDAAGELLAGAPQLAAPARALLDAGAHADELEAADADGVVCAVRSTDHAAVAVCGRFAIAGVVREDLRAALAALEGRAPGSGDALVAVEPSPPAPDSPEPTAAPDKLDPPSGPTVAPDKLDPPPEPTAAPAGRDPSPGPACTAERALSAAAAALISAAERGFEA